MSSNEIWQCLIVEVLKGKSHLKFLRTLKYLLLGRPDRQVLVFVRLMLLAKIKGWNRLSRYFQDRLARQYGIYIGNSVTIGPGLKLPHPTGIVLGKGVVIGKNCTIYQQVTIGLAAHDHRHGHYAQIGDEAVLYAGVKIIGAVRIGHYVTVGANAVVNRSIESHSIACGVPARVVRSFRAETPGAKADAQYKLMHYQHRKSSSDLEDPLNIKRVG